MRTDILECKEQILSWIKESRSKAFIARELHCKQETLNRYLAIMGIKYDGNQSGKGTSKHRSDKMNLVEYLKNSKDIQTNKIRIKLLEEGYKEHKCEHCGLTTWLDKPIPLELHHKDGDRTNNTLENFQLLCPNCHSFTDSYRGKNCRK
jgi:5-methylcytosine-specific restriction endonuclease McrA